MQAKDLFNNYEELATTPLRKQALDILAAGMDAIQTDTALGNTLHLEGSTLHVADQTYELDIYNNVYVLCVGKAGVTAGTVLEELLGDHITAGSVLDITSGEFMSLTSLVGTHPHPSDENVEATSQVLKQLNQIGPHDLLITVISGGGSALLCSPYKLNCGELTRICQTLMERGATIHELNTVRKHLSNILGGQLAKLVYPAHVVGLVFSDVTHDDLSMVASGPTVLDITTIHDAEKILSKYNVLKTCRLDGCDLKETPKDPHYFDKVQNELVVSNRQAVDAMSNSAGDLDYRTTVYSTHLEGEAREVGALMAGLPTPGEAIIAAGETTVTVTKPGKGGRNLEVALGALEHLHPNTVLAAFGTDGIDNTPLAGALVDSEVLEVAKAKKLKPQEALEENHSYDFFTKAGTGLDTGPTGVNVSDVLLVLRSPSS